MSTARSLIMVSTLVLLTSAAAAGPARGQSHLWKNVGSSEADALGGSLTHVPDVDGDGVVDILVGAANDDPTGNTGRAYVYSGKTGAQIREIDGDTRNDAFGSIVADLGDVDGDGARDFAIAAPTRSVPGSPLGAIFIVSGAGPVLRTFLSASAGGQVGIELSYLEDVDGDGVRDLLYNDFDGSSFSVVVASGATGTTIRTHAGSAAGYGFECGRVGDVDGDGVDDYGISERASGGAVNVCSGATGGLLFVVPFLAPIVRPAGDVDLDGHADLLLSNPVSGEVPVVSGATGQILYTIKAGSNLGIAVSRTGDFDGDGHPDLVATHPRAGVNSYDCNVYSGLDGSLLKKLLTGSDSACAHGLDATADIDLDGIDDIIAGNPAVGGYAGLPGPRGILVAVSPATGATLVYKYGASYTSRQGRSFTIVTDRDGDGVRDVAWTVPGGTDATSGSVILIGSGADGHELSRIQTREPLVDRPHQIVRVGDVSGDGVDDLAVLTGMGGISYLIDFWSGADDSEIGGFVPSDPFGDELAAATDASGTPLLGVASDGVLVYELKTGSVVSDFAGKYDQNLSCMGDVDQDGRLDWVVQQYLPETIYVFSGTPTATTIWTQAATSTDGITDVAATGDLDGDGVRDVLVGWDQGTVKARSGKDGSEIFVISGAYGFGSAVASLGDVNRDGVDDFAVMSPGSNGTSSVFLYSGATASLLDRIDWLEVGSSGDAFATLPFGDDGRLDPDPIPDLVAGTPSYHHERGRLDAFRLDDLFLQIDPPVVAAGSAVALATRGGPPGQVAGLFAVAIDGAPIDRFVAFGTLDATGDWSLGGNVPAALSGHELTFRSYAIGFQGKVVDTQDETLEVQ